MSKRPHNDPAPGSASDDLDERAPKDAKLRRKVSVFSVIESNQPEHNQTNKSNHKSDYLYSIFRVENPFSKNCSAL